MKEKKDSSALNYYSLDNILKYNCDYNIIIGERSNGKTYAALDYALSHYVKNKEQFAYVRRYKEDYRGKRGQALFESLSYNNRITEATHYQFSTVYYYAGRWFLANRDEILNKLIPSDDPIGYAFSLSDMEHDKSTSYPRVTTIIFDEFLTRNYYLTDEFVTFMNVVSTIVRQRDNIKIFMLGNTVNRYSPYFKEMGLTHVAEQNQGTIDIYTYGESNLRVAVEYADSPNKEKPSDKYFAFNNPKLNMVTSGVWELAMYPHLPMKYSKKDIVFTYFIDFNENLLQCEIISKNNTIFTFIHEKTTPLQDEDHDLIYSEKFDPRPNWHRNIRKPASPLEKKVASFYAQEQVYFQDNEVGEIVRNYLMFCLKETGVLRS